MGGCCSLSLPTAPVVHSCEAAISSITMGCRQGVQCDGHRNRVAAVALHSDEMTGTPDRDSAAASLRSVEPVVDPTSCRTLPCSGRCCMLPLNLLLGCNWTF